MLLGQDVQLVEQALDVLASSCQGIEDVPEFGLLKELLVSLALFDKLGEQEGVVGVIVLDGKRSTVRVPVLPQRPASCLKLVLSGRRR